jgi:hypothetical protein
MPSTQHSQDHAQIKDLMRLQVGIGVHLHKREHSRDLRVFAPAS